MIDTKVWIEGVAGLFGEIANLEGQRRCWLNDAVESNWEVSPFDELVNQLDDFNVFTHFLHELRKQNRAEEIVCRIKDFEKTLDKFLDDIPQVTDGSAIVSDSRWLEIVRLASDIQTTLLRDQSAD